ncbi:unnamed protein product [Urochloa humidicola]
MRGELYSGIKGNDVVATRGEDNLPQLPAPQLGEWRPATSAAAGTPTAVERSGMTSMATISRRRSSIVLQ